MASCSVARSPAPGLLEHMHRCGSGQRLSHEAHRQVPRRPQPADASGPALCTGVEQWFTSDPQRFDVYDYDLNENSDVAYHYGSTPVSQGLSLYARGCGLHRPQYTSPEPFLFLVSYAAPACD